MSLRGGFPKREQVHGELIVAIETQPAVQGDLMVRQERADAESQGHRGQTGILAGVARFHGDHAVRGIGVFPLSAARDD